MRVLICITFLAIMHLQAACMAAVETDYGETSLHFDFKTENGQQRVEDIKYNNSKKISVKPKVHLKYTDEGNEKPIEYRGGYSFISADGYEYTVKYKANKYGFQPYVTAHKLIKPPPVV